MNTQIIRDKVDLSYLSWSKIRHSSGTAGSFLKAYSDIGGRKTYYKLSNYNVVDGIVGHECVNEIIVDRLLTILGIEHLHYQLIHADVVVDGRSFETWVCASDDFKERGESKIALEAYYQAERNADETPLDFCIRNGWGSYIYQMLIVDYLILNRDRHGANIEVLRDRRAKTIRLAPLFDHGLSLIFNCHNQGQVEAYNVMDDKRIQCFVGSESSERNLGIIPPSWLPTVSALNQSDRDILFHGLDDALPSLWQEKIWEMIWKRWCYYEAFCDQRRR